MTKVSRTSYNTDIRQKIGRVLQSGEDFGLTVAQESFKFGYQTALLQTTEVTTATKVDDPEWDNLRLDLIKIRTHQKGASFVAQQLGLNNDTTGNNNVNDVSTGDKVLLAVYNKYVAVANDGVTDKFLVAVGEYQDDTPEPSEATNLSFGTLATWTYQITWANAAAANAFFNAGGSYTVGVDATNIAQAGEFRRQTQSIVDLLMISGNPRTVKIDAAVFYANTTTSATNVPAGFGFVVGSGAYSTNAVQIRVFTNANTAGSASRLSLRVAILSNYTGGAASGVGAGSIGFGDNISINVEPSVVERRSVNTVVAPRPNTYSYGDWSAI